MIVHTLNLCTSYFVFCAHLINNFLFLGLLNLDIFPSEMLSWCLVSVICNSSNFHSFIFNLSIMIVHTFEDVHHIFYAHLLIYFGVLNLDNITSTPPLECLIELCAICNSNRFHSFIRTLHNDCSHIENVHRRRMSRAEFGLVCVFTGCTHLVISFAVPWPICTWWSDFGRPINHLLLMAILPT